MQSQPHFYPESGDIAMRKCVFKCNLGHHPNLIPCTDHSPSEEIEVLATSGERSNGQVRECQQQLSYAFLAFIAFTSHHCWRALETTCWILPDQCDSSLESSTLTTNMLLHELALPSEVTSMNQEMHTFDERSWGHTFQQRSFRGRCWRSHASDCQKSH